MSKVFITGDTHGTDTKRFLEDERLAGLDKNDLMIVTGDFGVPWDPIASDGSLSGIDRKIIDFYDGLPFTTAFCDGNHENFANLNSYPIDTWMGGNVHFISDSVIHLMRGEMYTIGGRNFFVMGGAESIDKADRIAGLSWWEEETITYSEMNHAADTLASHGYIADYVVTHDMPASIMPKYFRMNGCHWEPSSTPRSLDVIKQNTEYGKWYFGHHHMDITDGKHTGLYRKIVEIDMNGGPGEEKSFMTFL